MNKKCIYFLLVVLFISCNNYNIKKHKSDLPEYTFEQIKEHFNRIYKNNNNFQADYKLNTYVYDKNKNLKKISINGNLVYDRKYKFRFDINSILGTIASIVLLNDKELKTIIPSEKLFIYGDNNRVNIFKLTGINIDYIFLEELLLNAINFQNSKLLKFTSDTDAYKIIMKKNTYNAEYTISKKNLNIIKLDYINDMYIRKIIDINYNDNEKTIKLRHPMNNKDITINVNDIEINKLDNIIELFEIKIPKFYQKVLVTDIEYQLNDD